MSKVKANPFLRVCLLLGFAFLIYAARADNLTNSHDELVGFFKLAISSPPDIEHFTASLRTLRERKVSPEVRVHMPNFRNQAPQFFEGARSGVNYFLREISGTNEQMNVLGNRLVVGRTGPKTYHFNPNTMSYTYDHSPLSSNPLVTSGKGFYSLVSQFLDMGLADIQPGSVAWKGYNLKAVRDGGFPVYGHLELSNGLPFNLSISTERDGKPFKSYTYSYPEPPSALSGYPARIIVSTLFEDILRPFLELSIFDIQLAKGELSEKFFSDTRFITTNILYTNMFSNSILYVVLPGGKTMKAPSARDGQNQSEKVTSTKSSD